MTIPRIAAADVLPKTPATGLTCLARYLWFYVGHIKQTHHFWSAHSIEYDASLIADTRPSTRKLACVIPCSCSIYQLTNKIAAESLMSCYWNIKEFQPINIRDSDLCVAAGPDNCCVLPTHREHEEPLHDNLDPSTSGAF